MSRQAVFAVPVLLAAFLSMWLLLYHSELVTLTPQNTSRWHGEGTKPSSILPSLKAKWGLALMDSQLDAIKKWEWWAAEKGMPSIAHWLLCDKWVDQILGNSSQRRMLRSHEAERDLLEGKCWRPKDPNVSIWSYIFSMCKNNEKRDTKRKHFSPSKEAW